MIKFRNNLPHLGIDRAQLLRNLDADVRKITEEAARIWVRSAISNIPVWSGASRATLESLGSAVGVPVPIDPKSNAPNRIGLGRARSRGGVEKVGDGSWRFFYESNLEHLAANETESVEPGTRGLRGSLIQPTPYQFREKANQAVLEYLNSVELTAVL